MTKKIQHKRNGKWLDVYADGRKTHWIERDKEFRVYTGSPQAYITSFLKLKDAKAFIESEVNGESK